MRRALKKGERLSFRHLQDGTVMSTIMEATLGLASVDDRVAPMLPIAEQIESCRKAQQAHVDDAERLLKIASRLLHHSLPARRRRAAEAVEEARRRVIAAETCGTIGRSLEPRDSVDNWSVIHTHNVLQNNGPAPDNNFVPNIYDRIKIIAEFLRVRLKIVPVNNMDDEIPF